MHKFLVIFFIFSSKIFAQTQLSLDEAIRIGLQNNYKVQISKQQLDIAKLNQNVGVTERFPSVSFDMGQNNVYSNNNSPINFVNGVYGDNSLNADFNANYILYNGNQRNLKKNQLIILQKQNDQLYRNTRENIIKDVFEAYFKTLIEKEKTQVLKETKSLSKLRLNDLKLQLNLGKASNFEVLRAENSFLIDSSSFLQQENIYQTALNKLSMILGFDRAKNYILIDKLEIPKESFDFDALRSRMIAQNHEILAKQIETSLNKNKIQLISSQRSPTIRLNSRLGRSFSTTRFEGNPAVKGNISNFTIGLGASVPIYNGGEIKRAINEALIENRIGELQLNALKQEYSIELTNAFAAYQNQLKAVKLNQQLVKNLGSSLQLVKGRLESGFSNALEYRTIQLEYVQSNFTYLESMYSLKSYEIAIRKLIGDLDKNY
ncbi:TolC family protein [Emticicia sediminis]